MPTSITPEQQVAFLRAVHEVHVKSPEIVDIPMSFQVLSWLVTILIVPDRVRLEGAPSSEHTFQITPARRVTMPVMSRRFPVFPSTKGDPSEIAGIVADDIEDEMRADLGSNRMGVLVYAIHHPPLLRPGWGG